MLRPLMMFTFLFLVLAGFTHPSGATAVFQGQTQAPRPAATPQPSPQNQKIEPPPKADKNQKNFTAEQVAESTIIIYGSRPVLDQIRRNGIERGRVCKPACDSPTKTEEASYERRFVRGENSEKDKIRLDQKMPTIEYSLIHVDGRLWGIINGASFTPRQDAANLFMSQQRHSIDALLRYKENGSTLSLVGRDKQKGLDVFVLDVVGKDKQNTRYYISAKTLRVLWLEYEEPSGLGAKMKFRRSFHDYRYAQSTLFPYRSVLFEDSKQTQETRILTITYGSKLDDALFKSPEA
ncbi:MAG TPA: hypothetical protein VGW36_03645 [Pyrinomonadaceae bacterium]|nr:hypothetical protein [Pyrinomonadaceae bacterium]